MKVLVYRFDGRYYIYPLGCCTMHQTKEDVFIEGGEEEIFTLSPAPGTPALETLRLLMAEIEKHGITDIEGLTIILSSHLNGEDPTPTIHHASNSIH